MSREQQLSQTFVELADALDDDFEVVDFLQSVVIRGVEMLHASAAAVSLADLRGDLQVVTSTTHAAEVWSLVSLSTTEGPCYDARQSQAPTVNTEEAVAERRWPRFTAAARNLGFSVANAFPMRLRSEVLGVLLVLDREPRTLDDDDVAVGQALASVAALGMLQERPARQKEILAQQLQTALDLRVVIEQAKGVIAELGGLTVEDSFTLMVTYARTQRRRLGDVAADIIHRRLSFEDLAGSIA